MATATRTRRKISAKRATTKGMSSKLLRRMMEIETKGVVALVPYWIHGADDDASTYCEDCIDKRVDELRSEGEENAQCDGGWGSNEEDGMRFCEKCQCLLSGWLTKCGVDSEIEHFEECGIAGQTNAYGMLQVLDQVENDDEYRDVLAKLCFCHFVDFNPIHKEAISVTATTE